MPSSAIQTVPTPMAQLGLNMLATFLRRSMRPCWPVIRGPGFYCILGSGAKDKRSKSFRSFEATASSLRNTNQVPFKTWKRIFRQSRSSIAPSFPKNRGECSSNGGRQWAGSDSSTWSRLERALMTFSSPILRIPRASSGGSADAFQFKIQTMQSHLSS